MGGAAGSKGKAASEALARERLNEELNTAARHGDLAGLEQALKKGADPLRMDEAGMTPLMRACWQKRAPCIERLIPVSDLRARNINGATALMMACRVPPGSQLRAELIARGVELLLPGSDPLAVDKDGRSALMLSARDDELGASFWKLLPVSDPGAVDRHGKSALDYAQEAGRSSFARALGALKEARDMGAALPPGAAGLHAPKLRV